MKHTCSKLAFFTLQFTLAETGLLRGSDSGLGVGVGICGRIIKANLRQRNR